jgi:hypothetical protein
MKTISRTGPQRLALAMAAICLWASVGGARAGSTLWYNGDFDGNSELYNLVNPTVPNATGLVYDDFIVPTGQTWTVQGVFSNDQMDFFTPTSLTAYWEIRSGVMTGDGGTLVASGTNSASQTATGNIGIAVEYTVAVSGLSVTLSAGTYWLAVAPVGTSADDLSFISTTSGMNAIGMPPGNDGNSFVAGSFYQSLGGFDFEPASDYVSNPNGGPPDFSMGVEGITTAVPEPSTISLGLIAALAGTAAALRRRAG